jgi:hypothetical protein
VAEWKEIRHSESKSVSRTLGYERLRSALELSAFPLERPAREASVKQISDRGDHLAVPRELAPAAEDLLGHALFALKHEGTNLQVLAEALPRIGGDAILRGLQETPNGRYLRLAAWLWETFTGDTLDGAPPAAGLVVPVFDPARYVVPNGPGLRSRRWRVVFNGLGSPQACMAVRRTPAITAALQSDLLADVRALQQQADPALLDRALAWAYLGETRASFEIEREPPSEQKARAFVQLLRHAHARQPLSEDLLVELQRATVSNPYDRAAAFRHEQNWLQDGAPGSLGVTYVPPPPELARELMDALMVFANGAARKVDPLVAAACVSFGFVLIHPFMDGNGRLSRFLFHHQLCQSGQLPDGLILPVSIAMAQHEREYLQALQSFSRPARERWRVEAIDTDRFHFSFTGAPAVYRYWDATPCVEFGLKMARSALDLHLQGQLRSLQQYDTIARTINPRYDLRGPILRTLIIACIEQGGRLSKRRRDQYAYAVPDGAFEAIEQAVREVLG